MNRFWGPLAQGALNCASRIPIYRYVRRAHPAALDLLATKQPVIFGCIHQDILDCYNGMPRLLQDRKFAAIVSYSRDGGLAAMGLRMLGYEVVRGSSSRGGGEGLMMLRASLGAGYSLVMACDGPKAPLADVKPGIVRLAATGRVPILPIRAWGVNRITFSRSWSKSVLTIPFLPVVVCIGAPIYVPEDTQDTRPYQLSIVRSIARLARWSSLWANGPGTAPFTAAPDESHR